MSEPLRRTKQSRIKTNHLDIFNLGFLLLYLLLSGILIATIYSYNFLNFNHLNLIVSSLLVLVFIFCLTLRRKFKAFVAAVLICFVFVTGLSLFFLKTAIDVSNKMNATVAYSRYEMSIVVPKNSSITSVDEVEQVIAPLDRDGVNIEALIKNIESKEGKILVAEKSESYQKAYEDVISGQAQAMVLNSAYANLLELSYPAYADQLKTIYRYTVEKATGRGKKIESASSDIFNIYISGIDTYGSISSVSRSDVNIIMTVNRKTGQVLLTTTPRDAYVKIADGGNNQYDKLTHAGIYGINASIHTLENLYDIKIDYYARLNFTSFLKLIDLVGGIEVMNNQAFTANGQSFPVGKIYLDSAKALTFVRERYSLTNGDHDRGKNQEKVIASLIEKLASIKSLANYKTIIDGLGDSIQTDMSLEKILSLATTQLEFGNSYKVTSQALEGQGSTGQLQSYAMPDSSLYMMQVDEDSLEQMKNAIKKTMGGN